MNRAASARKSSPEINRVMLDDRPVHEWYRFVLSYPPHLVRTYLEKFAITEKHTVLDPFCGTGTTLVEAKKNRIESVGIEANPMAFFASSIKLDWTPDPDALLAEAERIAEDSLKQFANDGVQDSLERTLFDCQQLKRRSNGVVLRGLDDAQSKLLLANSISPLPLHKSLVLHDSILGIGNKRHCGHLRLALAKAVVFSISNLHFGPEVGVTTPKEDAPVIDCWMKEVESISRDLRAVRKTKLAKARVIKADSRSIAKVLQCRSIDAVITSPPYPNEKDYTRTTRLESVLLGFLRDKSDLRKLKGELLRSNTRNVFKADNDDEWVREFAEVQRIANAIESRRLELGKTSGFERMYHRVAKLYFGGMLRHLRELSQILRPGARLAYVVGDQASYLRVMIRTGTILADVAESLGYRVLGVELFRTRLATATKEQLREEVVVLEWPGQPTARQRTKAKTSVR